MLHCDEETLSLLALGEPGPAAVHAHLADCERCQGELAALRQVVDTARSGELHLNDLDLDLDLDPEIGAGWHDVPRIAPPPRVWDQIAAATGVTTIPRVPVTEPGPEPAPPARPAPQVDAVPAAPTVPAAPAVPAVPAVPAQRSRSSRFDPRWLAIAASCLVIGLLGGVLGTRLLSDRGESAPVVAATRLNGLPAAPDASGQADVTETSTGRTLDLDVSRLGGRPDSFYEVWLIDPTVTKMVPIGVLSGTEGRFSLPAGMNLADYPLVDISIEPLDGNPAHSGKSVLRGTLRS